MRPIRAAAIVALAFTGCQKMDNIHAPGSNPRASEAYRYNRVVTTAGWRRAEPPDELTAGFLKKVPLGTPVAEAQRSMEREGFTCHLIPEGKDETDKTAKTKPGTLFCFRRDDPRIRAVVFDIQEGKVTRLRVHSIPDRRGFDPADGTRADLLRKTADGMRADLSKKIPPGTAVADAKAVMEQEGFTYRLLTGRVESTDEADSEYLDCERWENPGASSMNPADWGTRAWHVIVVIRDGKVTRLLVRFKSDRVMDSRP